MNKRIFAYGMAALIGLPLVVGCPGTGTAPTVPTTSSLKGTVKFQGTGKSGLTIGLKQDNGNDSWTRLSNTTTTANDGSYSFTGLNNGNYQAFYDDGGQVVTSADVNTSGVYVTEYAQVSGTQTSSPVRDFDVYWPLTPNPAPNGNFAVNQSFSWAVNSNAPSGAEYQVYVKTYTNNTVGDDAWSSGWAARNAVAWNGKYGSNTDNPNGSDQQAGKYVYLVKWRASGGQYGGGNAYGQSKWIPFNLTR